MTNAKSIISVAAISAFALAASLGTVEAAEAGRVEVMKPIHAVTFDAGEKHAVGYFYPDAGRCKLVLTLAGEPDWDDPQSFSASRFESTVPAGRSTRYTSEGRSFEFHCQGDAQAMTFRALSSVATAE
jgi:hypothetical protein